MPKQAARWLQSCLWSSRSEEALDLLRELRRRSPPGSLAQAKAARAISVGLAARGDHAGAAEMLATIPLATLAPDEARSITSMRAQALQKAGRPGEARTLLETIPGWDTSCFMVWSNTEPESEGKIETLNRVMRQAGHAEIRLADRCEPLSVSNLAARHRAGSGPDLGKVSVIFPVFNAERTIAAAVRSIRDQTYRNLEIIVVDDLSTDATWEILSDLAADMDGVNLLRSPENGGAYRARNLGLAHATGDYVTTHDADDWSHPEKIECQVRAFGADDSLLANGTHWARVDERFDFTSWELRPDLVRRSFPSFMVRRHVFDEIGPWDPVRISGDREFIYRVGMVYGADRVAWIAPEVPLGISLSEKTSLTGAKATHASSSSHGLRRYYHEIFKHQWRTGDATSAAARAARLAMCPGGMFRVGDPPRSYDYALRGDLTRPRVVAKMVELCDTLRGTIAITHVPVVAMDDASHGRFCDAVFALFQRPDVFPEPETDTGKAQAVREIPVEPDRER